MHVPLALVAVLAVLAGCGEAIDHARWTFDCTPVRRADPEAPTPMTSTPVAPQLDEAEVREQAPTFAAALDECTTKGNAEIEGRAVIPADRVLKDMRAFEWRGFYVTAMRYA